MVVAQALRQTLPDFLLISSKVRALAKFIADRQDTQNMRIFRLTAWPEGVTHEFITQGPRKMRGCLRGVWAELKLQKERAAISSRRTPYWLSFVIPLRSIMERLFVVAWNPGAGVRFRTLKLEYSRTVRRDDKDIIVSARYLAKPFSVVVLRAILDDLGALAFADLARPAERVLFVQKRLPLVFCAPRRRSASAAKSIR
jgi:hypothetical protein